jgi:hypothetical protein
VKLAILFLLFTAMPIAAQTKRETAKNAVATSPACTNNAETQGELAETKALVARLQNRIITIRNSAGTVSDFELRNALQVNADAWQDLLENLKQRVDRLQSAVDRCGTRDAAPPNKPR